MTPKSRKSLFVSNLFAISLSSYFYNYVLKGKHTFGVLSVWLITSYKKCRYTMKLTSSGFFHARRIIQNWNTQSKNCSAFVQSLSPTPKSLKESLYSLLAYRLTLKKKTILKNSISVFFVNNINMWKFQKWWHFVRYRWQSGADVSAQEDVKNLNTQSQSRYLQ